jgi:hypothetical protein
VEQNYDIWDLELLAVIKGLRHWRAYLAGSPHKVIVYMDHANLLYWQQPQKISRRIAREVLELSDYDIKLRHIPGNTNSRADMLLMRIQMHPLQVRTVWSDLAGLELVLMLSFDKGFQTPLDISESNPMGYPFL